MSYRVIVLGVLAVLIFGPLASRSQPVVPEVPKAIAIPAGHKLLFQLEARGVQIYKATKGTTGALEWILEAPLANLLDAKGAKAGLHYAGPSWEAADGSKVIRDPAQDVKSVPAPTAKEDIPWLLIKVKAEEGSAGQFNPTVYIQRLQTQGGKPPAELPKRVESKVGVPYKAVYYFYGKAN